MLRTSAPPALTLTKPSSSPASLAALADNKPAVVNPWASWCPPCQCEMPLLVAAQQRKAGVRFVLVNQGENRLDPDTGFGRAVGSFGQP